MSNFIAMKGSGGNAGGPSFIRPVIYGGGGHLGLSTSAATGSRKVRSRSFEIPCGWLQPLTSIIGPVRKLASEYSLERAHMGSQALEDHVVWLRPGGSATSSSTTRHGSGGGGQHQPQATFLHAHGANAELDRFEQQFLNAMEKTSRLVARYDGLVTYTQSFGAQQQDETTQKLLNLVAAPSPLAIQSSLSPPPHNSGHHHHRGDSTAAERDAPYHTESAEYHATPPPASSTNGQRRVTVSTTPSLSAHHDTPMTIAGEEETP